MRKKPSQEEILQEMQRRFGGPDNFNHIDVVWTGKDGNIDPDILIEECGWDSRSPLEQILFSLIAGHQPNIEDKDLQSLARKVSSLISGKKKKGNAVKDDGPLLLEIARRWHKEFIEGNWKDPELLPICRDVVIEYAQSIRGVENFNIDNISKVLSRKFDEDRDLWLARATAGDGYYAPERMDDIRKIKLSLKILQDVGVLVDLTRVNPTMPPAAS